MQTSVDFIKNYIEHGNTIICATSGGPDSMVLLALLNSLKNEYNLKIVCAHINHNLRKESEEEYDFVEKYCLNNNIIFEGNKFSEYEKGNIESIARKRRYDFFETLIKKYNARYLLTAHHGDDLIETILMKLTRGSSLDGYIGFNKVSDRDTYKILRPLIFYTKEEILTYAKENNIEYRIDKTNFDKIYTRNRYRMEVLPFLKKENKNVHLKYLKFSEELSQNNDFINKYINSKYKEIVVDDRINRLILKEEDEYISKKIIFRYLYNVYGDKIYLVESKHIDFIQEFILKEKDGYISLPLNKTMYLNNKAVYIVNEECKSYKILLKDSVKVKSGEIKIIEKTNLTNNYVTYIDSSKIKLPLYVRNKEDGDFIEVLNLNGKKKVKDIFVENKIDKEKRKDYPIVVDSENNIIFLPGLKKSKYDTLKSGKYDIIIWYNEEED